MKRDVNDKGCDAPHRETFTRELDAAERRLANIVRFAAGAALGTMVMLWATGNAATDPLPETPGPAAAPVTGPLEFTLRAPAPAPVDAAGTAANKARAGAIGDDDRSRYGVADDAGGGQALQSY